MPELEIIKRNTKTIASWVNKRANVITVPLDQKEELWLNEERF